MANAWLIRPLAITSAAASESAAGFSPSYVGNDYAGVVWQSTGSATASITLDFGQNVAFDTIALFGLSGFASDDTVTIAVATAAQGSSFGASSSFSAATAVLAGDNLPISGRGMGLYSIAAPMTGRYVRLSFAGLGGAVQVARAVVGKRFAPTRNFSFGGAYGVRDLGSVDFSRRGVLLRTRGKKLRTIGVSFTSLYKDEVEASTKPLLEQIGNTETVALVTDPAAHAERQNRMYFGPLVGDLSHVWRTANAFEARVNLVSLF